MKKHIQLLLVETCDNAVAGAFRLLLQSFSDVTVAVQSLPDALKAGASAAPDLALLHGNLTTVAQLQEFLQLKAALPHTGVVMVSKEQDEELGLLSLEAGAEDSITEEQLTERYVRKAVVKSRQRNRVEKERSQRREQLLACLQNTPNVAVQWYNGRGEAVFWNKASERLYGWTEEEALGKTVDALITVPENRGYWLQRMTQLKDRPSEVITEEWMFTRRDGRRRYCLSTLFVVSSIESSPLYVCMDVDITERYAMEAALRESEEKYRSLIEQQADALVVFDKDGNLLDVNGSTTAMLGYAKEELKRLKWNDLLQRDERGGHPADFTLLQAGASLILQHKLQRKNGTAVETEVHVKRLFDGLFMASIRDLAERMDVQRRLQKETALSDSIINSLPGLFYLFTRAGAYLRWNRRQEVISGYAAAEIVRMKPLDFIAGPYKKTVQKAINQAFKTGQSAVEAGLLTKEGKTIPYYFTGTKVQYGGTECLLGTGIDLSAMKNLEKQLSQQKIAEQKKVMQAMIDAEEKERHKLGLELHDNVNQILSVVRMYLSVLNAGERMEEITLPKAMDLLDNAITEIRHLSHSLAISYKFETGLATALEETTENIRAAKGLDVRLSLPPQLDDCTTVRQKLAVYRIVQEQLNNVIKHAKATKVAVAVTLTDDELQLAITDNGKGFHPAKAKKGLGLSNIINRAEALEGKAAVHSEPGKGARLQVVIPLVGEEIKG